MKLSEILQKIPNAELDYAKKISLCANLKISKELGERFYTSGLEFPNYLRLEINGIWVYQDYISIQLLIFDKKKLAYVEIEDDTNSN